jgi:hypothetical protein
MEQQATRTLFDCCDRTHLSKEATISINNVSLDHIAAKLGVYIGIGRAALAELRLVLLVVVCNCRLDSTLLPWIRAHRTSPENSPHL